MRAKQNKNETYTAAPTTRQTNKTKRQKINGPRKRHVASSQNIRTKYH